MVFYAGASSGVEPLESGDLTSPIITNKDPLPSATDVPKDKVISFHIEDAILGVDLSNTTIYVEGNIAYTSSAFQNPYDDSSSITGNANDYTVQIAKDIDWDSVSTVTVRVVTQDLGTHSTDESWDFDIEDYIGPLVVPINPTNGQIEVALDSNIQLSISDDDSVEANLIKVEIDSGAGFQEAFIYSDSPKFKSGFDGPGSTWQNVGGVYTIVIDPISDFPPSTTIYVRVTATDPTGNATRI